VILLIGSQARLDHPADALSDVDLVLYVTGVASYQSVASWPLALDVAVTLPSLRSDGYPEYVLLLADGGKLDLTFFPITELQELIDRQTLFAAYSRGYRVLLDRDRLAAQLPPSPFAAPPRPMPDEAEFQAALLAFLYGAYQEARQLARGQLWWAKVHDRTTKDGLLQMLEWQARAQHGPDYYIWYGGRFLSERTDPATWAALGEVYGHFDATDSWRALFATITLWRRLAVRTAQQLGYAYATDVDRYITGLIEQLRAWPAG
jgi:aminoglycoside 6-adenylyltransferase